MGPWQDANTVGMEKCGNPWSFKVFKKKKKRHTIVGFYVIYFSILGHVENWQSTTLLMLNYHKMVISVKFGLYEA